MKKIEVKKFLRENKMVITEVAIDAALISSGVLIGLGLGLGAGFKDGLRQGSTGMVNTLHWHFPELKIPEKIGELDKLIK